MSSYKIYSDTLLFLPTGHTHKLHLVPFGILNHSFLSVRSVPHLILQHRTSWLLTNMSENFIPWTDECYCNITTLHHALHLSKLPQSAFSGLLPNQLAQPIIAIHIVVLSVSYHHKSCEAPCAKHPKSLQQQVLQPLKVQLKIWRWDG
jgi:hypothetical protein